MRKLTLFIGWVVFPCNLLIAQAVQVPGQFLFQLREGHASATLEQRIRSQPWGKAADCANIAQALDIWLLSVDTEDRPDVDVLTWLREQPEVCIAQRNHFLQQRDQPSAVIPDDSLYALQWHHRNVGTPGGTIGADLSSELAWDIATGGLTPRGDTIALAIVDSGIDAGHEDLAPNMWHNWGEIAGDGVDNDYNGYVDDFLGWNVLTKNDQVSGVSVTHGTPIAALAGARANNSRGIAGVNWNVKLLFVVGNSTEDVILSAFDYALQARRRYNRTNGQQGAFVVALNCSWGINGGKPSDAPLWCAALDSLGKEGILTVAATANLPVNVDTYGDLPTTCPSDFLISVTSLTAQNQKAPNAAWGPSSIDLGAYGEAVFTARPNNQYGFASGTSFAAPLVSGAIALLYSAPCTNLIDMARANPAAAALWVKSRLLASTLPTAALNGTTVSGGRLNLLRLLKAYEEQCSSCVPPFGVEVVSTTKDSIRLSWSSIHPNIFTALRWREKNALTWNTKVIQGSSFSISDLMPCATYEFSLQSLCSNGDTSAWTVPIPATTSGCCTAPQAFQVTYPAPGQVLISWVGPSIATAYSVRLTRPDGTVETLSVVNNQVLLPQLLPCSPYRVEVTALCTSTVSSAAQVFAFFTNGCGACLDRNYCAAGAAHADQEWIKTVKIGSWTHQPQSGNGYQNYTSALGNHPVLFIGQPTPIFLSPGYAAQPYREHFRVYVDFNGDGDFTDADELAFDPGFPVVEGVEGTLTAPAGAQLGLTRLRILMKYRGVSGAPPAPCEQFEFGQVADYCVRIEEISHALEGALPSESPMLYPNPARQQLFARCKGTFSEGLLQFFDTAGHLRLQATLSCLSNQSVPIDLSGLPSGVFLVKITTPEGAFWEKIFLQRQ